MNDGASFHQWSLQRAGILTLLLVSFTANLLAQHSTVSDPDVFERFTFDDELSYAQELLSPAQFLGYELGQEYTHHYQVVDYFEYLAANSDRIQVQEYGTTYEGRSLIYATISSVSNMGNLEQIKEKNKQLASHETQPDSDMPVVVWMSYNVHGNEPSSSESAMQAAYRLVAAEDNESVKWRAGSVVIIDPMLNPDGRDRYITWYKSSQTHVLNTDVNDLEHDEIWPGGRTNHYWFDLNRDWVWLVHPESQGRIKVYQEWMPQVHMDFHEQGANNNYFLMPGTTPRNYELPRSYEDYADAFGRGAVKRFDEAQVNYFTREAFDFFYPGYGSSYPSVMGGIGMLAEQGGHSRGGRAVDTDDGYVLTLRQRVFDHYINSLAVVETAVKNRMGLLGYFKEARNPENQKGDTKAYILFRDEQSYSFDVVNLLLDHGVQVYETTEDQRLPNTFDYWDANEATRTIKEGSFVIPTEQPAHLFIHTLFRRQLEIRDSVMYDMSTWTVPMAYNLEAYWSENLPSNLTRINQKFSLKGQLPQKASYAYVMDWAQRYAPNTLGDMLEAGFRVRTASESFGHEGKTYSRGSVIVLVGRNLGHGDQLHSKMEEIALKNKVSIVPFNTGRMDTGIDLASSGSNPLHAPRVAIVVDQPFNSYTAGQLWYLLDYWTEYGISRVRSDRLAGMDLDTYDVLIFPGAWGGIDQILNESVQDKMKEWVRSGGVLVGTEGMASWLSKSRSGFTNVSLFEPESSDEEDKDSGYTMYADRAKESGLKRIPGAAFKSHIDNTHPLGFGMKEQLYTLKFSADVFELNPDLLAIGRYVNDPNDILASGYASLENKEKAASNSFAAVQNMGQGKVVLLLENTQYRMFWIGPSRMIQNAVFQLPAH